jgi:hypothetical protein
VLRDPQLGQSAEGLRFVQETLPLGAERAGIVLEEDADAAGPGVIPIFNLCEA